MRKSSTGLRFSCGIDDGLSFNGVDVWAAHCLPRVHSRFDLRAVRRRMIEEIVCWPCWYDCEAVDGLVVDCRWSPAFAFVIDQECTRLRHRSTFGNSERVKQMHGDWRTYWSSVTADCIGGLSASRDATVVLRTSAANSVFADEESASFGFSYATDD